jgi:hypothetical protein
VQVLQFCHEGQVLWGAVDRVDHRGSQATAPRLCGLGQKKIKFKLLQAPIQKGIRGSRGKYICIARDYFTFRHVSADDKISACILAVSQACAASVFASK